VRGRYLTLMDWSPAARTPIHQGQVGRRFLADVERMTTDPRPARANGTRLRAMASSIRRATSGRASVDAPSTLIERICLPDPCNNFAGSGNSLPPLKYSITPLALARIARTPSYPRSFGE